MADNVNPLKRHIQYKNLAKQYERLPRGEIALSPDHLPDYLAPYYPTKEGGVVYAVTPEPPFDGWKLATEVELEDMPYFNSLLIYRMLTLLYGPPDILGAYVLPDEPSPRIFLGTGVDWGYTFSLLPNLAAEVRSLHTNTRFRMRFWMPDHPANKSERRPYGTKMADFLLAFTRSVEKNRHLFNEEELLSIPPATGEAFANVFSEKYRAAERLLELAIQLDLSEERRDLQFGEKLTVSTSGHVYLSAAIFFVIALEALINAILTSLLKEDFMGKQYERLTTRADLDVRFISAHVFCAGFPKQILSPRTGLWKRLIKLRQYRNDVVHGNITPDHRVYAVQEDVSTFFYSGVTDFRGTKAERRARQRFPYKMQQMGKNTVLEIKETVDLLVDAVLEAADDKTAKWLKGWIWEALIPPPTVRPPGDPATDMLPG